MLASGALQRCLDITPGQAKFTGMTAAGAASASSSPGPRSMRRAGQRFQAGDHVGAAKLLTSAAQAGHPLAQLRLAIVYEAGDGVPRDPKAAVGWYARATSVGEPAAQRELGGYYEEGDGVAENSDLAAKLYQASAAQGWSKGQLDRRKLRFGVLSGDPAGVTFHSSAQRAAWLTGQRREVDLSEAHTMWSIRSGEYQQCQRAGGSNCVNPGPDPARR